MQQGLGLITDKAVRRSVFYDVEHLEVAIERYLEHHNADPKPFVWTTQTAHILKNVARAKQVLESNSTRRPRIRRL